MRRPLPHQGGFHPSRISESDSLENSKSSYEFHCQLEGFSVFCRREWKSIAFFGGAFCLAILLGIAFIDPAFFYPRLSSDPLNYYLKAKALVETGSTTAASAINLPPFPYAAMPGVLRAPFIMLFDDFDDQLRAMQVFNTFMLAGVALMSAYIFSWVHSRDRHRYVIAFAFAFTILSPIWLANVFLPLADAPYAAFSLAALLILIRIICAEHPFSDKGALAAAAILFAVAFPLRFTAPVLLAFAAVLVHGRLGMHAVSRRGWIAAGGAAALLLIVLVAFNVQAIFGRYFFEPLWFARKVDKLGMITNLFGVALPSQVIPNFQLGFVHPPIESHYTTKFTESPADVAWMTVGLIISVFIVWGLWKSRNQFLPEIAYVLVPLPVLAVILPSTTRYFMSYQPFIWIFFYVGSVAFARQFGLARFLRRRALVAIASGLVISGVVGLRWWRTAGTASERVLAVTLSSAPGYITAVSRTFRGLRHFLETLPQDRTLLIGDEGSAGRWTIIAGRNYYYPDESLPSIVRERDVYLLAECGTLDTCQSWDYHIDKLQSRVLATGQFSFDSVYASRSARARVEVFRIRNSP